MKTLSLTQSTKPMAIILLVVMLFGALSCILPGFWVQVAQAADDSPFDAIVDDNGNVVVGGNVVTDEEGNQVSGFATILSKYKGICTFILGLVTITMIIFMILQFMKLAAAGDNQQARKAAIGGILTTGVAVMLLGSLTLWFGFFYHAIQ